MTDETEEVIDGEETLTVETLDTVQGLHEVSCDVPWCSERVGRVVEGSFTVDPPMDADSKRRTRRSSSVSDTRARSGTRRRTHRKRAV